MHGVRAVACHHHSNQFITAVCLQPQEFADNFAVRFAMSQARLQGIKDKVSRRVQIVQCSLDK